MIASGPKLQRRDIALVTFAGVAPDIDGLGIVPEVLTRGSAHPLTWFTDYHHVLAHNLLFAAFVTIFVFAVSRRRFLSCALAFIAVHLHFAMDILGSRGPEGFNWPIPYFEPFSTNVQITWSGQWVLNSWQNVVITCLLIIVVMARAIQIGKSPVQIFSPRVDQELVQTLRLRWEKTSRAFKLG